MAWKRNSDLVQKLIDQGRIRPEQIERPRVELALPAGENHAREAAQMERPARSKFGAIPSLDAAGFLHKSRLQARVTDREAAGCRAVWREVSIPLAWEIFEEVQPDGTVKLKMKVERIVLDLVTVEQDLGDGRLVIRLKEVKGFDQPAGKQKRKRFEEKYGVSVEVVTK